MKDQPYDLFFKEEKEGGWAFHSHHATMKDAKLIRGMVQKHFFVEKFILVPSKISICSCKKD